GRTTPVRSRHATVHTDSDPADLDVDSDSNVDRDKYGRSIERPDINAHSHSTDSAPRHAESGSAFGVSIHRDSSVDV
ncbi:MAG: hypothetical protein AABZ58_16315, partial [Chloroflexota bacterium]